MVWYGVVEVCEGAPVAVSGIWYGKNKKKEKRTKRLCKNREKKTYSTNQFLESHRMTHPIKRVKSRSTPTGRAPAVGPATNEGTVSARTVH